jgi:hypothetical protein
MRLRRQFDTCPVFDTPTSRAANLPNVTVQLDHIATASGLVQAIHVLRDQSKPTKTPFQFSQGIMPWIRADLLELPTPFVVPGPDLFGSR